MDPSHRLGLRHRPILIDERTEPEADQAIAEAPPLLGLDEIEVDRTRGGQGLQHGRFGDFREDDALDGNRWLQYLR